MQILNIEKFKKASVQQNPFEYFIIEDFINPEFKNKMVQNFPNISKGGSFPIESLEINEVFQNLINEFTSEEIKEITAKKLKIDLSDSPTMLTARGYTRENDGQIHIDSNGKLVTFLLYMNENWEKKQGGCLRLLKSKDNMEDYICEIKPKAGTLLVFKCTPNAWHGHKTFIGERKSMQMNYVVNNFYYKREKLRHKISAFFKKYS